MLGVHNMSRLRHQGAYSLGEAEGPGRLLEAIYAVIDHGKRGSDEKCKKVQPHRCKALIDSLEYQAVQPEAARPTENSRY